MTGVQDLEHPVLKRGVNSFHLSYFSGEDEQDHGEMGHSPLLPRIPLVVVRKPSSLSSRVPAPRVTDRVETQ